MDFVCFLLAGCAWRKFQFQDRDPNIYPLVEARIKWKLGNWPGRRSSIQVQGPCGQRIGRGLSPSGWLWRRDLWRSPSPLPRRVRRWRRPRSVDEAGRLLGAPSGGARPMDGKSISRPSDRWPICSSSRRCCSWNRKCGIFSVYGCSFWFVLVFILQKEVRDLISYHRPGCFTAIKKIIRTINLCAKKIKTFIGFISLKITGCSTSKYSHTRGATDGRTNCTENARDGIEGCPRAILALSQVDDLLIKPAFMDFDSGQTRIPRIQLIVMR